MTDSDAVWVHCPYCFEQVELWLEEDVHGEMVVDCEVCCNPWRVRASRDVDGDRTVEVDRAQ